MRADDNNDWLTIRPLQRSLPLQIQASCANDVALAEAYGELHNSKTPGESSGTNRAQSHGNMLRFPPHSGQRWSRSLRFQYIRPAPGLPEVALTISDSEGEFTEVSAETPAAGASAGLGPPADDAMDAEPVVPVPYVPGAVGETIVFPAVGVPPPSPVVQAEEPRVLVPPEGANEPEAEPSVVAGDSSGGSSALAVAAGASAGGSPVVPAVHPIPRITAADNAERMAAERAAPYSDPPTPVDVGPAAAVDNRLYGPQGAAGSGQRAQQRATSPTWLPSPPPQTPEQAQQQQIQQEILDSVEHVRRQQQALPIFSPLMVIPGAAN